jgi:hypothetical protein
MRHGCMVTKRMSSDVLAFLSRAALSLVRLPASRYKTRVEVLPTSIATQHSNRSSSYRAQRQVSTLSSTLALRPYYIHLAPWSLLKFSRGPLRTPVNRASLLPTGACSTVSPQKTHSVVWSLPCIEPFAKVGKTVWPNWSGKLILCFVSSHLLKHIPYFGHQGIQRWSWSRCNW